MHDASFACGYFIANHSHSWLITNTNVWSFTDSTFRHSLLSDKLSCDKPTRNNGFCVCVCVCVCVCLCHCHLNKFCVESTRFWKLKRMSGMFTTRQMHKNTSISGRLWRSFGCCQAFFVYSPEKNKHQFYEMRCNTGIKWYFNNDEDNETIENKKSRPKTM